MKLICGDSVSVLKGLPEKSIQTCVTSPPYFGLRDYGHDGQIGLEDSPELYVQKLVAVFREVKRVLKDDGVLWLNLGDSYWGGKGSNANLDTHINDRVAEGRTLQRPQTRIEGMKVIPTNGKHAVIKPKDLIGIPWMVAFALRADGWYLRSDIIWHKPNPMPESVKDRPTKSHEHIFLLSKSAKYFYDADAVAEPQAEVSRERAKYGWEPKHPNGVGVGIESKHYENMNQFVPENGMRNKRDVWTVTTKPYKGAHFATFPPDLITPCILAGSREGDTVLDPFVGSGTTLVVAKKLGRCGIGVDLNDKYIKLAEERLAKN